MKWLNAEWIAMAPSTPGAARRRLSDSPRRWRAMVQIASVAVVAPCMTAVPTPRISHRRSEASGSAQR